MAWKFSLLENLGCMAYDGMGMGRFREDTMGGKDFNSVANQNNIEMEMITRLSNIVTGWELERE